MIKHSIRFWIFMTVGIEIHYAQTIQNQCNQSVYGTDRYIKDLPKYVCIPHGNVIDDYVRVADLDVDGKMGKSFVFVFNSELNEWHLQRVEYFIGELPRYWWENNDFYYALSDKIKVIESRRPTIIVPIDHFSLIEASKHRDEEINHLQDHINELQETTKTVMNIKFKGCSQAFPISGWQY